MLHLIRRLLATRYPPRPRPVVRSSRPSLEPLEDRSVPAAGFVQTNLVSDLPGVAQLTDANLRNPWGVAVNPNGDFWVSNAASGTVTLYRGDVNGTPLSMDAPVITVPHATGLAQGEPSGQVFNNTTDFAVSGPGSAGPALFIFAGLDGTISAEPSSYNGNLTSQAVLEVTTPGAIYTGLALGSSAAGNILYAANTAAGTIDVFNGSFKPATLPGKFLDPTLPATLTPFNVANIGGTLYVTYHSKANRFAGGLVDKFDTSGNFLGRFADGSNLVAPWGVVMTPANFGDFGNDLLVGNFGDGRINAYSRGGVFLGQLTGMNGQPLAVERLWQLTFGNGAAAGGATTLYFAGGLNQEKDGLFGSLRPASANDRFLAQAYSDLLQRPIDTGGLTFWNGQMNQGAGRQQVAAAIEASAEYRGVEVRNLYSQLLHRTADPAGITFYTNLLGSGTTVEQAAAVIAGSQEYFRNRGGGTASGFLSALYQDGLGRALDNNGKAVFTAAMQSGATPGNVAAVVFASDEFKAVRVRQIYQTFLHRGADSAGLGFFVGALQQGARDEDVIAVIVSSAEYFART
jgi:uncharacterized protein (TIGR03118 family)